MIRNYALCKNGNSPYEWRYNEDRNKPCYGRILFVKSGRVLLMQRSGKPWKLPGLCLQDRDTSEDHIHRWSRECLGITIDQFEHPLGLFTIGVRQPTERSYSYRETLVYVPMMWREGKSSRAQTFDLIWQPINALFRNTSFAARDFLKEYQQQSTDRVVSYDFAQAS